MIEVPHLQPEKNHQDPNMKEADQEKNMKEEDLIKTRLKVYSFFIYLDRRAKIRIPELTSSLLSFKGFLQNQVIFSIMFSGLKNKY